jgi:hypothetical protein
MGVHLLYVTTMKKNSALYYLLMLLLVMGAFASMALNSYGITLMSYVGLAFSLVFIYELIVTLPRQQKMDVVFKRILGVELLILSLISLLYFFRGINLEVSFSLILSNILLMGLVLVNSYYFYNTWNQVKETPVKLRLGIAFYFSALFLLIASHYLPTGFSRTTTVLTWVCLIGFVVIGWWKGTVIVNGAETSAFHRVIRFKNKTGIQLIVLTLFATYSILASLQVLPSLYVGSLPNGYAKVVRQWEMKVNDPGVPPTNPNEFEKAYKKFLEGK